MIRRICKAAAPVLICLALVGCAVPGGVPRPRESTVCAQLSPAQQYAGQVLSYLMQVVLGRAGHPDLKAEWSRRGLSAPLDFERISRIMLEPDQNRSELVVFDTRILGISDVLYHYDPGLNLFNGKNGRQSLFPSVELIALRLIFLQKMHRGEKVRLKALLDRRELIFDRTLPATARDLRETGLRPDEFRLMRQAFNSDPHLFAYLYCPPMVKGLYQIGAVAADPVVFQVLEENPPLLPRCRFGDRTRSPRTVRISVLPSMMPRFWPLQPEGNRQEQVFSPDESYLRSRRRLEKQILQAAEERLGAGRLPTGAVVFSETAARPLAIHPGNADLALSRYCPEADFTIILLGKDVIRCFEEAPRTDFPARSRRLYIDVMDIERSWITAEIEIVARFIAERLGAKAAGPVDQAGRRGRGNRNTPA